MNVTGLRVSIDASPARQGEQAFNQSLDSMAGKARTVSAQLRDGFKPGEEGLRSLGATGRTVSQQLGDSFEKMRTGMRGLLDSVLNFRTLFDAAILGISFRGVIDQIAKVQDIKFSLQAVTGSAVAAGAAWRMLQGDAEKYGYQAEDLAQKFARLSMATKGTALEGQRTVTIFRASEIAARALGTGAEGAERTIQSFTNILSSANVQGDMMVRQLARFGGIPGAMSIAARAFGVSINTMQEKLKSGTLSSEEFVAKFTQQMVKELGPAAENAANGISAWKERVSGAFKELVGEIGGGGLADTIVGFLKTLRDELESPGFKEAANQLGTLLTNALRMLGSAIEFAGNHLGLLKAAFVGIATYETIAFFSKLTEYVFDIAKGFRDATVAAVAFASASRTATVASEVGAVGAAAAMFAGGGVMTSQGPAPVPGSQSKVPEGRIDTVRSSILAEGYVSKPNVAFESGGILTSDGPRLLKRYAEGGVADSPHVALFGEGSKPEAFVPLQDGSSIPVSLSASSAFVPLPDGRKIPVSLDIKRFAAGGTSDDDTSLVAQMARQQDSINALELSSNVVPAGQAPPTYKPTRTVGAAQGAMPPTSAAATGQAMVQESALPTSAMHRASTVVNTVNNNNQFSLPTTTPTTAAPAQAHRADASVSMGGGLMKALESVAPALVAAVVFLRRSAPATIAPTSTLTTMRTALRSEPQDSALHQVGRTMIETRAVSGVEECAKKAASGLDSIANAAKPAERSLLSFSDAARALPRVSLPASGTPPISSGISKLMSEGHGGLAYSARTAQLAGAARPPAGIGEQLGLFAGQEALGDLGKIGVTAEKSAPKVLGLFEAMGVGVRSTISGIGAEWKSMWSGAVSVLLASKDSIVSAWKSGIGTIKSLWQGLGNVMSTEIDASLGRKISVGLANKFGVNQVVGIAGEAEEGLGAAAGVGAAAEATELGGGLVGATGAAGGLSGALAAFANPIGIAVAAVALLAGGLYAVRNNQVSINGEAFKMGDIYSGIWMKIKQYAEVFWNWLSMIARKVFNDIMAFGTLAIDSVFGKGTTSKIEGWLGSAWEGFKGFFYNVAKQAKEAREQVEALAQAADIREKVYGSEKFLAPGRAELTGSLQPSVVDQIMQLEAQYPRGFAGKTPKEAATVQIPLGPGMGGGMLPVPSTPDELKLAASIRDQINNLMMGIGTGAPEKPFRQPEPPWKQAINELQSKASLAAPTAVAALYGQDEVERLRQVVEAEKMIAELGDKGPPKERIRGYFDEIARGNILLKANTEIEKERAKILAEPMMGRTPTFEFVDRSTFGGANPERDLALAQENIKKLKLPAPEYAKAMDEATAAFERFMAAHVKVVELKPLGFDDVTQAIQHGTFAYEEYMHLEQQQLSNWERLKDASVDMVAQWNKEAEATYLRTAAMKEYAAISAETEKAQFEIPRMRQLQTAQLQGGEAARGVQAQQAQEAQLFQITGARNWNEFKQQYGAALSTPEALPTPVQSYAQNLGLIGGKPQQAKMLGVDIGTEQNPLFVMIAKVGAKKVGVPVHDAGQTDMFSLSNIVGPEVSAILGLGQPQVTVPLRPQGVQTTTAPFNPSQNMASIDEAAAKDLTARMDLARQQSIDKTITEIAALDSGQALKEYEDKLKLINAAVAQQPELWAAGQQAMENAARAYQEQIDKMLEATHNFVDGAKGAFDEWATHAMDAGAHAKDIATGFMNTLQKGITDGLTTGKTGFAKMFVDLKKQIVGAEVEQYFTGPIAQGLGSVIPALKPAAKAKTLGVDIGTEQNPLIVAIRGGGAGKVAGTGGGATSAVGTTMSGETILGGTAKGGSGGGLLSGGAGGSGQTVGSAAMQVAGSPPTSGKGWENLLLGKGNVSPLTRLITWGLGPHGDNKAAPGPLPLSMLPQLEGPSKGITPPQLLPETAPRLDTTNVWPGAGWSTGGGAGFNPVTDELAGGGPVRAGRTYLVGEKGRELFVPREDGQIIPNKMFAKGGVMSGGDREGIENRSHNPSGTEFTSSALAFAQGGTIGVGGIPGGGGGSVINPAAESGGTSVSPSGLDLTVAGSGMLTGSDTVQYLNDPITKKLRYALFNWQATPQGGFATPTGMMKQTGPPYQRNWWLTDFLPTAFMLFSNFINAYRGISAGGGGSTGQMFAEAFKGILGMQQTAAGGTVGSVGGVSDPGLGTPSYMPGGGPTIAAPDITTVMPTPTMPNLGTVTPQMPTLSTGSTDLFQPIMPDNFLQPQFGPSPSEMPSPLMPENFMTPQFGPSPSALQMPDLGTFTPQMPTLAPGPSAAPSAPSTSTAAAHSAAPPEVLGILAGLVKIAQHLKFGGGVQPGSGATQYAGGGIMTPYGNLPLRAYDDGGIATRPMAAIFGEGSMHEAYVPLPDGRTIPVSLQTRQGGGDGGRSGPTYNTAVHVHGVQDVDSFRRSRGQIMAEVSNAQATHRRANR